MYQKVVILGRRPIADLGLTILISSSIYGVQIRSGVRDPSVDNVLIAGAMIDLMP